MYACIIVIDYYFYTKKICNKLKKIIIKLFKKRKVFYINNKTICVKLYF